MRIIHFSKVIELKELEPFKLKDSTVVIDGHNFLYTVYLKSSELSYEYGCETNRYAEVLRDKLNIFKMANVKCYFIFKGGNEDVTKVINKVRYDLVNPTFMRETYKQILNEMGFVYVICEYEAKRECIAFAQKLRCPIISFDVEFCFSGVPYIPDTTLRYNNDDKSIDCGIFVLERFMRKNDLSKEKLAMFVVLRDTNIFPDGFFEDFLISLDVPRNYFKENIKLLSWLSRTIPKFALNIIFSKKFTHTSEENRCKFLYEMKRVEELIDRQEIVGIASKYLENEKEAEIQEKDPEWFEKGVTFKHIPIRYINLYHFNYLRGTFYTTDKEQNDAILFSLDIIKYAYDLLTNFKKKKNKIDFYKRYDANIPLSKGEHQLLADLRSVRKPKYEASECVFENGWSNLRRLRLFEHFFIEKLQNFDFEKLERVPEDARLLMIALIYFSRKKGADTSNLVYSVLMSYVMLNVVSQYNSVTCKDSFDKHTMDDGNVVTKFDYDTAQATMEDYFKMSKTDCKKMFDKNLTHPFYELQHCIENVCMLNILCDTPYKPTIFYKTFNGTFVYKVLYTIENEYNGNGLDFFKNKLNTASSVLSLVNNLIEAYQQIMF